MATLPYTTAPSNIEKALKQIKVASTPPTVSHDYVKTMLKIPGSSGTQITSFLKKIGFVNKDGTPTELYNKFRNSNTTGFAAAKALKIGYKLLYERNEFMHALSDKELKGLIIEETGSSEDAKVVSLTLSSIKAIKKFADFSSDEQQQEEDIEVEPNNIPTQINIPNSTVNKNLGLNLSYTINLNLPATSDIAVFNSIFKSLKENLLRDSNE